MIQLVIFAGQSNLGLGMSTATLPDHLKGGAIPNTYMFTSASTYWGGVVPGTETVFPNNPGTWGAADQFAYNFHQTRPDDILLVVEVGHGSTGIAADPNALDWSPASHGEMFDLTEATLARALAALAVPAPAVSAVFFVGLETDATDAAKAAHAGENLDALTDAIRDRLMHDPNGHIGMTRISDTPVLAYNQAVREAVWSADQADDNLSTFKTVGLERQADNLHDAASAHVAIGDAFSGMFEAWL